MRTRHSSDGEIFRNVLFTTNKPSNMAQPHGEEPHIVSLVLQSKTALQQGEQLCSNARDVSMQSAQTAVDVLALDAKVRWMTDAVLEQLKVCHPKVDFAQWLS
jgi:hypothetical protein